MLRPTHFYHTVNQEVEVSRVLVTREDLGTQKKQTNHQHNSAKPKKLHDISNLAGDKTQDHLPKRGSDIFTHPRQTKKPTL